MILPNDIVHKESSVVALGGGGARGLAHFGAVQAILEAGYSLERIVGTSIGSLVGGMIAAGEHLDDSIQQAVEYVTSAEFESQQESLCGAHPKPGVHESSGMLAWYDRIKSYLWTRRLLSRVFRYRSLLSGKVLDEVISQLIPDIDVGDTRIPFSVVTVDLRTGHQVVIERGPLRKAIRASAAIPGIFPPVEWDHMLLCDLGVLDSLPTQLAHCYPHDVVMAVDVGPSMEAVEDCQSALHVLLRMDEIGERLCRRYSRQSADILICPDVGRFEWFDFSQPEKLIAAGLQAGRVALGQSESPRTWSRPPFMFPVHDPA